MCLTEPFHVNFQYLPAESSLNLTYTNFYIDFFVVAHVKVDQNQAAELLKSQNQSQVCKDLKQLV